MRPDYCPLVNEPCQSLCDEPCTRTPQRKPLTDEQIWQIATDSTIGGDLHADKFARAIEAKHGIKEAA